MELDGLPLHPLVVHAAVVFVPLAGLLWLGMVVPAWHRVLRWPALVAALIAAAAAQLAVMSGEDLRDERGVESPLISSHELWAERLQIGVWVLAALAVVSFLSTRSRGSGGLGRLLPVLTAVVGLASVYLAFRTGDAGSRSVWGG